MRFAGVSLGRPEACIRAHRPDLEQADTKQDCPSIKLALERVTRSLRPELLRGARSEPTNSSRYSGRSPRRWAARAVDERVTTLPAQLRRSLVRDQEAAMAQHAQLRETQRRRPRRSWPPRSTVDPARRVPRARRRADLRPSGGAGVRAVVSRQGASCVRSLVRAGLAPRLATTRPPPARTPPAQARSHPPRLHARRTPALSRIRRRPRRRGSRSSAR
jgi:hypothetical protein